MNNFSKVCKNLRRKGCTLGEISKITNRPKTTVYFHIRDIPKNRIVKEKIRKLNIQRIKGLGPVRGKSLLGRKYKKFKRWNPDLVNLFAHALFDGSVRHAGVLYHNRNQVLLDNFRHKMRVIYGFKPKMYKGDNGVFRLAYHNVELAEFFKTKTRELLQGIPNLSRESQRTFLQAFFDDEGSVDFRAVPNVRRVKGYQNDKKVLRLVSELLQKFRINSVVSRRFHEIVVSGRKNLVIFANEVNFSEGVCVNGDRSNSIWRKSLEKRRILKMALGSYKNSQDAP